MTLAGVRVKHPWVDSSNGRSMRIVGYPPIQSEKSWKESNILLGAAVHAVVKHLQLNPPQLFEITDKGLQSIQSKQQQQHQHNKQQQQQQHNGNNGNRITTPNRIIARSTDNSSLRSDNDDAPPSYNILASSTPAPEVPMPTVPNKYPQVENLSREQLDSLMDDELEFVTLVHKLDVYDDIFSRGSSRLNENVKLANENLEQETKLRALQNDAKELHQILQSKLDDFSKLEARQNSICAPPDKTATIRKLTKAKKEAFDESENLAETWVEEGGMNVDDFCKQFLEKRTIHHMRAAKMEILKYQRGHEV
jgi:ESCRT-I complex subunit VPS37